MRIFSDIAGQLNMTLLLRATNPASVRWMGQARSVFKTGYASRERVSERALR